MRSRVRIPFETELLLPDVTRRLGKPLRFSSDADRLSMERLRQRLARFSPLSTVVTETREVIPGNHRKVLAEQGV